MPFTHVIGHERPGTILQRAIAARRVSHAYLFAGPPSIGKSLVAREFAKAVNCETNISFDASDAVQPCDQCSACTRIDRGTHPDVRVVRPLAKVQTDDEDGSADVVFEGAVISTEQIGDLIAAANLKAGEARRKVFIISSAESMNPTSANRLLKTLEEPPGDTTLILTTQNLSALLPTIISRCQMLTFHPTPLPQAQEALASRFPNADPGALRSIVALSGGRIGWCVRLLQRPDALALRTDLLDLAASLPGRDWFEGMVLAEALVGTAERWWLMTEEEEFARKALKASRDRVLRTKMNEVLDVLITWFRDLALLSAGADDALVINSDRALELAEIAAERTPAKCRKACEDIEETRKHLRGNANLRLACEILAMKLISACR